VSAVAFVPSGVPEPHVPELLADSYHWKVMGGVPPDGFAVSRIDCPSSMLGDPGVMSPAANGRSLESGVVTGEVPDPPPEEGYEANASAPAPTRMMMMMMHEIMAGPRARLRDDGGWTFISLLCLENL
jgi:hypothetical protein